MSRVFRVFLCAAFTIGLTVAMTGCGGSSAKTKGPPTHSEEELQKARELGKKININMGDKLNPQKEKKE